MLIQKDTLEEANRTLTKYLDSHFQSGYIGKFTLNGRVSLALDGNFELTELIDIIEIAQRYKLVEQKIG
jgi:hypothetical protein